VEAVILDRGIEEATKNNAAFQGLIYSISLDYLSILNVLLTKTNVSVNQQSIDGNTPIMYASKYGKLKIVQYLLLQTNIDITLKNKKGDTALSLALKNGHRDVVNVLRYGPSYVVNP